MALEEFEGDLPEEMDGELLEDEEETPEELRKRLAELDEQAAQLKEYITKNEAEMKSGTTLQQGKEDKEEADSRSVYVGNVDYGTKPEELQVHFKGCGVVNRVTILTDRFGNPKGFAYIEFQDAAAVQNALLLSDTEFRDRVIKVSAKRTNTPGKGKKSFNNQQMMNPMMNPMMMPPMMAGGYYGMPPMGFYGGGGYGGGGYGPMRGRGRGGPRGGGRGGRGGGYGGRGRGRGRGGRGQPY